MPKLTDEQLLAIVQTEFRDAMGSEGGELSHERAKALDYYLGKQLGNEVEGESQVVTSDVADVLDGIMPSLLRIFTTADNVCSFEPVGPEDEEQADQASDYVNHIFFKKNQSFLITFYWMFDALLQKNGIVMAWWDESEKVTQESYQNLTIEELTPLLDDKELEAIERDERPQLDEAGNTVINESGEPVLLHDVTFRRVTKSGRIRVDNVPPDEYRISSDSRSLDPSGARMVGRERDMSRSDLIDMGFDRELVESLPATKRTEDTTEKQARRDKSDDQNGDAQDKSQELVHVRECYLKVDFDGDGRSELRQIFEAGGKILSNEVVDRQPFHVICPGPLPHKHFGRSSADKVMDVQEVSTTLLRQVLMNLYHTNNPRHGVSEVGMSENTLDDLLTNRVGGVVRFGRNPNESYTPMTVPFTASATFPMLEYFEKVKRDRTGISSDGEGLSPEALKNIQSTVLAQSVDLSKMKVEMVARIFAETGFKSLFLHIHELALKHQKKADVVKLRNRWVPIDPRAWRTRDDMTVGIGLGVGTSQQNLLDLQAIWEKQIAMVEGGGMNLTVTPKNIFNTAAEIVKNSNRKVPEMFFTDPGDAKAPPPSDEQQELQQMQMQLEQRRQELDAQDNAIKQQKADIERERMQLEHQRALAELDEKRQKREDDFLVAMENVRNFLTKLEVDSGKDVPGSAV